MDVSDRADSDKIHKKCDRVRSWYMYEQLKSLEKDQQDAARRLKSKSSMDRVLRRGLAERRVRRRLSDQFSSCHSELQRSSRKSEVVTPTSCSVDNFFVDLCEQDTNSFYNNLQSSFIDSKESIISNDYTDSVTRDYDMANLKMSKNLNRQLQNMKGNIDSLDLYDGEVSDQDSFGSCELPIKESNNNQSLSKYGINTDSVISMWSKLVTYAHQIMKLHHGANCYVDYSSQFLTAVLVVDVLRMVVCRMCDILQPFVCPISYNSDKPDLPERKKKHTNAKHCRKNRLVKFNCRKELDCARGRYYYRHSDLKSKCRVCRVLEKSLCKCRCLRRVIDNVLQLSHLVDDMLDTIVD